MPSLCALITRPAEEARWVHDCWDTSVICKLPASPKAAGQDSDRKVGESGMDGGSPTTRHGSAGETSRSGLLGRGPNGGLSASTSRADVWGVSTISSLGRTGSQHRGRHLDGERSWLRHLKWDHSGGDCNRRSCPRGAGDASPTKPHPLSRPGRPRDSQCNETQDSIADEDIFGPASPPDSVTRPALKRFTSETEKRLEDAGWSGLGSYGSARDTAASRVMLAEAGEIASIRQRIISGRRRGRSIGAPCECSA